MKNEETTNREMEKETEKRFVFSIDDIDQKTARNAFYNSSFSPDRRGEQVRQEYISHMENIYEKMQKIAETDEQKSIMIDELNRYKIGYLSRLNACLRSEANCASSMITGPANFPVERNRKRMQAAQNKYNELTEFSQKASRSICKKIDSARNGEQVTDDEFYRLKKEFDKYIEWNNGAPLHGYQTPLYADKIKRSFQNKNYEAVKMLLDYIKEHQETNKITHFSARHSIWKLTAPEVIQEQKENEKIGEIVLKEFPNGVKIVNNYDDERIRIFFDGKPADEIRDQLKRNGFKWSPKNVAWQRQNTSNGMYAVKRLLEVLEG